MKTLVTALSLVAGGLAAQGVWADSAGARPANALPARTWTVQLHGLRTLCTAPTTADNLPHCALPGELTVHESTLTLATPAVHEAGQAIQASADFAQPTIDGGTLSGRLTIYAVVPRAESHLPPYDQIRLEITAPVRALCLQSVKYGEADLPPLFCLTYQTQADGTLRQLGARLTTLHWQE